MNALIVEPQLNTSRMKLESLNPSHAEGIFPLLQDRGLYKYIDENPPESTEKLRKRYEFQSKGRSADGKELWFYWIPKLKRSDDIVGHFQASVCNDIAYLAYFVFKPFQMQGYAKEGMLEIIRFLDEDRGLKRFIIEMDTRNLPSIRLALSLGFNLVKTTNRAACFKGFESHEFQFEFKLKA